MATLYLLHYNNYYNKIVKKESTLAAYQQYIINTPLTNIAFNPNDGVSAEQIVNWPIGSEEPNYCVVSDNGTSVTSRWFVTEAQRTRAGQYRMSLLRDVAADYLDELKASTCYIDKGYTSSSPLVFNSENMGFNQIKTGEYKLENNLKTPWLVLYLSRYNNEGTFNTFEGEFDDQPTTRATDYVLNSLSEYKYYYWSSDSGHHYIPLDPDTVKFGALYIDAAFTQDPSAVWQAALTTGEGGFEKQFPREVAVAYGDSDHYPVLPVGKQFDERVTQSSQTIGEFLGDFNQTTTLGGLHIYSTYTSNAIKPSDYGNYSVSTSYTNLGTSSDGDLLQRENGKTIRIGDDVYRIDVRSETITEDYAVYKVPKNSGLWADMSGSFWGYIDVEVPSKADNIFWLSVPLNMRRYQITFSKTGSATTSSPMTYNFKYDNAITRDASYEILAAPYNNMTFSYLPDSVENFVHNGDVALQWFQNIINKYHGAGQAYDLQLVPYCPIDTTDISTQHVTYCGREGTNYAVAIQLPTSTFSTTVRANSIPVRSNAKLSNELDLYRIVSPNGVGEYEWSPAKNGLTANRYEVDCTLIPFNPYIKINPVFTGLYGKDFDDYRGLICGGDFSLPIISSEWETYQLQNKFYQDIFNRNIEHQEFNNKYALAGDISKAITGTAGGAAAGAAAGSIIPGIGTVIGAAVGGLTSAAGGIADTVINDKIRKENIDYQKDEFGFELGTIKARAQSLTRSTSYNKNNKYFPYVEYYTCTDVEKTALENKMKYRGMTIGVIGKLSDYIAPTDYTYVQGTIIDIDIKGDSHIADQLDTELRGGFRIA